MQQATQYFYGHGKLLLTGEYAVLDGSLALAIPTKFGQSLEVSTLENGKEKIHWESFLENNEKWLHFDSTRPTNSNESQMLVKILSEIKKLNPDLFRSKTIRFKTKLEFNRQWGLGSSSTLLYCISQWANVDPFLLLKNTFGGSGYDLASAGEDLAILYSKKNNIASWRTIDYKTPIQKYLYFVYLGNKKNSRDAIAQYRNTKSSRSFLEKVNELTTSFYEASTLKQLQEIILDHETLLSHRLKIESINKSIFTDLNGTAKSLGAWGGDFALVASDCDKKELIQYFKSKKMNTVFSYNEMVYPAKKIN